MTAVIAVARRGEAPVSQIAKDFGDLLRKRAKLLEQENGILRRAAATSTTPI